MSAHWDEVLDRLLANRHSEVLTWIEPRGGRDGNGVPVDAMAHVAMTVHDAIAFHRQNRQMTDREALDGFRHVHWAVVCQREPGTGRVILPAIGPAMTHANEQADYRTKVAEWLLTGAGRHWLSWADKPTMDDAIEAMLHNELDSEIGGGRE